MSHFFNIFIMASAFYSFMYVRPPSHSSIRSHGNYTALNQTAINHRGNKNSKNGALSRLTPDQTEKMKIEEIEEGRKKVIIPPPSIHRCCLGNLKHLGQYVRRRPRRLNVSTSLTSRIGTILKSVPGPSDQTDFYGSKCNPGTRARYTECRQSSYAHNEKEGQSPFARRESHACNITMKGKWDVLGSPSEPWQTRRTSLFKPNLAKKSQSQHVHAKNLQKFTYARLIHSPSKRNIFQENL